MSSGAKQAMIGLAAMALVLLGIAGDAAMNNRHGLRATVLSARAALPGETVTITVSARDTDGSVQHVHIDFGDDTSSDIDRGGACHKGASAQSFDFRHAYRDRADYTVEADVTSGGCSARTERASTLRGISVKPLQTGRGRRRAKVGGADLHERQLELRDRGLQLRLRLAQPAFERFHDGGQRVDGDLGLVELRRLQAHVQSRQFEEPETVVRDHDRGGRRGQLVAHGLHFGKVLRRDRLVRTARVVPLKGPLRPRIVGPRDGAFAVGRPERAHEGFPVARTSVTLCGTTEWKAGPASWAPPDRFGESGRMAARAGVAFRRLPFPRLARAQNTGENDAENIRE